MKKSTIKKLLIIAAVILSPFAYCQIKYPSYTYRYKMTVEVETPEGIKTGSSVVEVHTEESMKSLKVISNNRTEIRGEGVFIEIEKGKILFILLGNGEINADEFMSAAFPMLGNAHDLMRYYGTLRNAKGTLPEDKIPPLVSAIADQDGHTKFTIVQPEELKEAFGTDVKIKQIIIETTNDPIEWKIRELPMYGEIQKYIRDSARNRFGRLYFSTDYIIF